MPPAAQQLAELADDVLELDPEGRFRTIVHMFGQGGGERLAGRHGFPLLGQVPLNPAVRVGGDGGDPVVIADPTSPLARCFSEVAGHAAQRIAVQSFSSLPILD